MDPWTSPASRSTVSSRIILIASDAEAGDRLGGSVAISGRTAIAGAHFKSNPDVSDDNNAGAAYIFQDTSAGGDWSSRAEIKLTAGDAGTGDKFGIAVGIDGDTAIVGANSNDSGRGAVYIYQDTSAADDPPLEPPGERSRSHGLRVTP